MPPWLRAVPGGVELLILVRPRASRSRIAGEHDGRLTFQLAAPPVDGEANAALIDHLAALLGVSKRQVLIAAGDTSRRKTVRVDGITGADAVARLPIPA